ncbi:MAG: sulfotransferase [Phycisphaerales bacterium]
MNDDTVDQRFADHPPILLIGTHRSGTTFFGDALGRHPDIAYWVEPRHIWTRGNAYTPDDRLDASHATPAIRRRIRRALAEFVERAGKRRLAEKTPSNCLRLPFIDAVLPEARILLILRDGRSVLRSTGEIMQRGTPIRRVVQRAGETPITEWPAAFGAVASLAARKITRRPMRYWGPKPPGWRNWIGLDQDELMARQWVGSIACALDDAERLGPDRVLSFRYEDLMAEPESTMRRIVAFTGLSDADELVRFVTAEADPTRVNKWRAELTPDTLERVRPIMEPTLERLGYRWEESPA